MHISEFIESENGAVTTDWVLITAGIVGLGIATAAVVTAGTENLSNDIGQSLADVEIGYDWAGMAGGLGGDDAIGFVLDAVNRNGNTVEDYQGYIQDQVYDNPNYTLQQLYDYAYTRAQQPDSQMNDTPDWIDYLAVIENEATTTGDATIPAGNTSAASLAADWRASL